MSSLPDGEGAPGWMQRPPKRVSQADVAWRAKQAERVQAANDGLPMQTLDLAELAKEPAEPKQFAIERLAPVGEVTLFTGPGSAGKSLLAQQLATAAAAGLSCLGLEIQRGPAIYLTCEDDAKQLHWRQEHICEALGVNMADLAGTLHLISRRGEIDNEIVIEPGGTIDGMSYPDRPGAAYNRLAAMIRVTGARLVFLDNVAHLFPGNENDRGEVTRFVNLLNRLAGETGAAIVLIGHPNKSGDSYSGSTAWLNAVRSQITLDNERDGDGMVLDPDARVLRIGKANYARLGDALRFRWHRWAYILEADLPADMRAELDATIRATGENTAYLRCLAAATDRKKAVSENPGTNYFGSVFPKMPEAKGLKREAFERAHERLLAIGEIELDAKLWQRENRAWKFGIRAVEKCTDPLHRPPAPTRTGLSVNSACTDPPSNYVTTGAADWPAAPDDELDWEPAE